MTVWMWIRSSLFDSWSNHLNWHFSMSAQRRDSGQDNFSTNEFRVKNKSEIGKLEIKYLNSFIEAAAITLTLLNWPPPSVQMCTHPNIVSWVQFLLWFGGVSSFSNYRSPKLKLNYSKSICHMLEIPFFDCCCRCALVRSFVRSFDRWLSDIISSKRKSAQAPNDEASFQIATTTTMNN